MGVTITDPNGPNPANPGGATETVTVTPSSMANGRFYDLGPANDGSTVASNGAITLTGTASAVTADLDGLTFLSYGNPATTTFTVSDTNWAGLTTTTGGISVLANLPSSISGTQANQATTDVSLMIRSPTSPSPTRTAPV